MFDRGLSARLLADIIDTSDPILNPRGNVHFSTASFVETRTSFGSEIIPGSGNKERENSGGYVCTLPYVCDRKVGKEVNFNNNIHLSLELFLKPCHAIQQKQHAKHCL